MTFARSTNRYLYIFTFLNKNTSMVVKERIHQISQALESTYFFLHYSNLGWDCHPLFAQNEDEYIHLNGLLIVCCFFFFQTWRGFIDVKMSRVFWIEDARGRSFVVCEKINVFPICPVPFISTKLSLRKWMAKVQDISL